jgi:hypothetical protein
MNTKINSNEGWDLFGMETFAETWIIVTDRNGCDIQVTLEDLIEEMPIDKYNYVAVCYYGKNWWIPENLHFKM